MCILSDLLITGKSLFRSFFQVVGQGPRSAKFALAGVLLGAVLLPSHPLRGGNGHWVELFEHQEKKESYDLLKIYSVLRTYRMDLRETQAWHISQTILGESLKHALDPLLVLAVINVESHFRHAAVSPKGARGLMQLRPFVATALAQEIGLGLDSKTQTFDPESLDDPILNIKLGVFYLQDLKNRFQDVRLALTAYNWGPTEIKTRLDKNDAIPEEYASKVLSKYRRFRRVQHGIS